MNPQDAFDLLQIANISAKTSEGSETENPQGLGCPRDIMKIIQYYIYESPVEKIINGQLVLFTNKGILIAIQNDHSRDPWYLDIEEYEEVRANFDNTHTWTIRPEVIKLLKRNTVGIQFMISYIPLEYFMLDTWYVYKDHYDFAEEGHLLYNDEENFNIKKLIKLIMRGVMEDVQEFARKKYKDLI